MRSVESGKVRNLVVRVLKMIILGAVGFAINIFLQLYLQGMHFLPQLYSSTLLPFLG